MCKGNKIGGSNTTRYRVDFLTRFKQSQPRQRLILSFLEIMETRRFTCRISSTVDQGARLHDETKYYDLFSYKILKILTLHL